jgi:hypothetical protein
MRGLGVMSVMDVMDVDVMGLLPRRR